MPVTVTPLGMRCNLQCGYCYEEPLRDAGNFGSSYDMGLIKSAILLESNKLEPFLLFGGEPLLIPKEVLKDLWAWGFEHFGRNVIQTNGSLIDDEHIALFKRYKVGVGISIDGPGSLNDARWNGTLEKTRACTRRTEAAICVMCSNGIAPSLIVTLHRLNASEEKLATLMRWFRDLSAIGVNRIGLHLLEVETEAMRTRYMLSDEECISAISKLRTLRAQLPELTFSLLEDLNFMMESKDAKVRCIWQACDPYTTAAVRGIGGRGERTKCSRINKEGIDFLPSSVPGYERYIALYHTPHATGGCQGCRFFLCCRGQCPGTAISSDWRNKSEQCHIWTRTFESIEKELVEAGAIPISLDPERPQIEERLVRSWENGRNLSVESIKRSLQMEKMTEASPNLAKQPSAATRIPEGPPTVQSTDKRIFQDSLSFHLRPFLRLAWTSEAARAAWEPTFRKMRVTIGHAEFSSVLAGYREAALLSLSAGELKEIEALGLGHDLVWETLDDADEFLSTFLDGASAAGPEPRKVVLVGQRAVLRRFFAACEERDYLGVAAILGYPQCCAAALQKLKGSEFGRDSTWAMAGALLSDTQSHEIEISTPSATNIFFRKAGVRLIAHRPCGFHCTHSVRVAKEIEDLIGKQSREGADTCELLNTILDWPVEWSALHGIAEVRSPILKLCFPTDATATRYIIRRLGSGYPSEGARGLAFPYLQVRGAEVFNILR
jgi:uncharacterized protein